MNMLLVGGPSDGRRINVEDPPQYLEVIDPMHMDASYFDLRPNPEYRFPSSRYILTNISFNDDPICFYAHQELTTFDAWHRLLHRYPNPENETSRTHTRRSTLGI